MNISKALSVITVVFPSFDTLLHSDRVQKHCEEWDTIKQHASQETLETLKSAVNVWTESIQDTIRTRFANNNGTLELRHRRITRGDVSASSRSLVPIRSSRSVQTPNSQLTYYGGINEGDNTHSNAPLAAVVGAQDPMINMPDIFEPSPEPVPSSIVAQTDDGYVSDNVDDFASVSFAPHPMADHVTAEGPNIDALLGPPLFSGGIVQEPFASDSESGSLFISDPTNHKDVADLGLAYGQLFDGWGEHPDIQTSFFDDEMNRNDVVMDHREDLADFLSDLRDPAPRFPPRDPLDPKDMEIIDSYVENVCKTGFCPRYPRSQERMSSTELRELLEPLTRGTPLTKVLIFNLLLAFIPALLFLESDPDAWGAHLEEWKAQSDEPNIDTGAEQGFLATLETSPETSATFLLILADKSRRNLLVIGDMMLPAVYKALSESHGFPIDLVERPPQLESTLALVYMAVKSTVNSLAFTSARDLRFSLIRAFLVSSHNMNGAILQQLGIKNDEATYRTLRPVDRVISSAGLPALEIAHELYNPEISSIPPRVGGKKTLRMLQCIKEVGSVTILEALKVAAAQPRELLPTDGPSNLLQIHHYLDTNSLSSHLDVARTRFVKHCYFSAFHSAVETLAVKKQKSRIEKRRRSRRLSPQNINDAPATDWIKANYPHIDHTKTHPSEWIVRETIVGGIQRRYGGRTDSIKQDLDRYLNEGATLRLILQGLEPALLVLFPGNQYCDPCLCFETLEDAAAKAKLKKPIKTKDIDALTEKEANWFGQAMQVLRPELYEYCAIPAAIALLGLSPEAEGKLQERDPSSYAAKPLDFLA